MQWGQSFQKTVPGKLDIQKQNTETRAQSHHLQKSQLKIYQRTKYSIWNYETTSWEHKGKLQDTEMDRQKKQKQNR